MDLAYRAARSWADDLASDGGARRDRVSSLIDAAETNDNNDDDNTESVQSDHDRMRIEALCMLNLDDDQDGSTERRQRERDADRVAANAHSFSTKVLNQAWQSLVAVSGSGGSDHLDHLDKTRVTDNTDPKQRATSLSSRALEEDDIETPQPPRRSRFHFRRTCLLADSPGSPTIISETANTISGSPVLPLPKKK